MRLLARAVEVLERIACALELLAAPPQSDSNAPVPACEHPPDLRHDFGRTNGQDDWQCAVCGFRTVTV